MQMKNVPDVTTLPSGTFFVDGSGRFPDHAEVAVRQERQSRSESADDRRDISLFSEINLIFCYNRHAVIDAHLWFN